MKNINRDSIFKLLYHKNADIVFVMIFAGIVVVLGIILQNTHWSFIPYILLMSVFFISFEWKYFIFYCITRKIYY